MTTNHATITQLLDTLASAGDVSAKKMFGEYALYCDGKVVALVCDDQLFVKPTVSGRAYVQDVVEGFPYPGAKPWFLISGDFCDDSDWLTELIVITANELPVPIKKQNSKKGKKSQ